MLDPSYALQQAVYTTLTTHAGVSAIVGAKVFHRVPDGTPLPFIVIGQDIVTGRDESGDFSDCDITVHAFADGLPKAKQLAGQVIAALNAPVALTGFSIHEIHRGATRHVTDPDGLTGHSIIEFEYVVQATPDQ
jgi:hypothetical protein